jgi:hypothetical protein
MPMPIIHRVGDAFDDRNPFLQVLLGTIALLRRFRELLRQHGSPSPEAAPTSGAEPVRADELSLYFVLGLISISQQLMQHASAARAKAPEQPGDRVEPVPASSPVSSVILRRLLQ